MPKTNPAVYPVDLFLFRDEKGIDHIYKEDPIRPENASSEVHDFANLMYGFMSRIPSRQNPILVRVKMYAASRTVPFSPDILAQLERDGNMHLMDKDGNIVIILEYLSKDPRFPYIGNVLNTDGTLIDTRNYSTDGECADGDHEHSLFAVAGPVPLEKRQ